MKTQQLILKKPEFTSLDLKNLKAIEPHLLFVFGGADFFKSQEQGKGLKSEFPEAFIIGCSTAGEISDKGVSDNSLVITGLHSEKAKMRSTRKAILNISESYQCGHGIGAELSDPELTSIYVLGKGVGVNGVSLINGIRSGAGSDVIITGGLAGDDGKFVETWTHLDGVSSNEEVVAIGFYGKGLSVGYGSAGGWKSFGPIRTVTKSSGNIVYGINGAPALDVYKKYLGDRAKDLPGAGLHFPFALLDQNGGETGVVRTIFGIIEKDEALVFGGDIPEGSNFRLMFSDTEKLTDGAALAAEESLAKMGDSDSLALLVSCVGRRLVLGNDIDEEIDAVRKVIKLPNHITGFYSNGEISPVKGATESRLHNQTMTITLFSEKS